jgi:hypothetical protein
MDGWIREGGATSEAEILHAGFCLSLMCSPRVIVKRRIRQKRRKKMKIKEEK